MPQNLQLQLDALVQLRRELIYLNKQITELSKLYKSRIDQMVEEGLPIQIHDTYSNSYLESHCSALNTLVSTIEEEDISYINRNIEVLQKLIESSSPR